MRGLNFGKLTAAVLAAEGNHALCLLLVRACLVGAVTDAIAEIWVAAQAGRICSRAAERWSQSEHIADACLLSHWSVLPQNTCLACDDAAVEY